MPFLTICTPTFNRQHTLKRLFDSLVNQSVINFEWIVVDDGSTDNTKFLMQELASLSPFSIRYIEKQNGGKHTAVNLGLQHATGTLCIILDSDDWLDQYAAKEILDDWKIATTELGNSCIGLRYLSKDKNGFTLGEKFPGNFIDGTIHEISDKHSITGDKMNVFDTQVGKRHPFPIFANEMFCPEGTFWNNLCTEGLFRHINKALQIVEYQTNGLSANNFRIRYLSPLGTLGYYESALRIPSSKKLHIRNVANHYRFLLHRGSRSQSKWPTGVHYLSIIGKLLGFFLFLRDRLLLSKEIKICQEYISSTNPTETKTC